MNLMKYESQYRILDDMLEESGGVVTPEIEQYMSEVNAMTVAKVFDLVNVREELDGYAKICKEEADRLSKKAKSLASRADWWKSMIVRIMASAGQKSVTNGAYKITLTKNPLRIEIEDETAIPSSYKTAEVKMSWSDYEKIKDIIDAQSVKIAPDKKEIGNLYKSGGVEVAGVKYVQDDNVRIS